MYFLQILGGQDFQTQVLLYAQLINYFTHGKYGNHLACGKGLQL